MVGISIGGAPLLGPSGPSTIGGVNIRPDTATQSGNSLAVDLLAKDGSVVSVALPTTGAGVQQALAPLGNLVGALAGESVGGAVNQATGTLSPGLAAVTSTLDSVVQPVLDGANGVLSPIVGEGGLLAPVTGLVDGLAGNLPVGTGAPARTFEGPLLGVSAGGSAITGPATSDTVAGINVLSGSASQQGQLVTASVLSGGSVLEVNLPTTAQGVEAGLAPVGNLAGAVLGEQAGALVDSVVGTVAPVIAPVTTVVDGLIGEQGAGGVLAPVNGVVGSVLGGGAAGGALAPVTGVVGAVLGGGTADGALAPITGVLAPVLGGGTDAGGILAPVTGVLAPVLGGGTDAGGVLAPVTGVVGQVLGGLGGSANSPSPAPGGGLLGGLLGRRGN